MLFFGLLLLLGLFGWYYFHVPSAGPARIVPCTDMVQGCGNQQLQIHFDQSPQVMRPFNLRAKVASATEVHASFAMQGMEMGLNRYRLLQKPDGLWQAEVTLPVCIQGRSDWLLELEVKTPVGMQRYRLPFSSQ
ncbi:MAG: hypothetical protein ABI475_09145 [Methylophilaceae bacterium]